MEKSITNTSATRETIGRRGANGRRRPTSTMAMWTNLSSDEENLINKGPKRKTNKKNRQQQQQQQQQQPQQPQQQTNKQWNRTTLEPVATPLEKVQRSATKRRTPPNPVKSGKTQ